MNKTLSILLRFGLFILLGVYVFPYIIEYIITPKENEIIKTERANRIEEKDSKEKDSKEKGEIEISDEEIIKRLNDSIYLIQKNFIDSVSKVKRKNDSIENYQKNKEKIKKLREKLKKEKEKTFEEIKIEIENGLMGAIKVIERILEEEFAQEASLGRFSDYTFNQISNWYNKKVNTLMGRWVTEEYLLGIRMTKEEYYDFQSKMIKKYGRKFKLTEGKHGRRIEWIDVDTRSKKQEKIDEDFLIKACLEAFIKNEKMNHFKEDNSKEFCNCFAKNVLKNFSKKELSDLENSVNNSSEKFIEKAYFLFKNKKIQNLAEQCFGDIEFDNESYIELNPEKKQAFIKQCKEDYITGMSSREIKELSYVFNLDGYCDCLTVKMTKEFSASELLDFNNNIPNRNPNNKNLNKLTKMAENCASKNIY